jgi:L-fucose isomerase-like protein
MEEIATGSEQYRDKSAALDCCASWGGVPEDARDKLVKLGMVLDRLIEEYKMDAIALRCWVEMQTYLGISPCVLLGELNQRGIAAACEVDCGNAIAMHALKLASYEPPACLDWNNNYADDDDKCILFHCGPVPPKMMVGQSGCISDHSILANAVGAGRGYGCNVGRIAPCDFTFASMMTSEGKLRFYLGEGEFTNDPIPADFFGCAGVAHIPNLQDVLLHVGNNGYRHHVSVAHGNVVAPMREALEKYLGMTVALPGQVG